MANIAVALYPDCPVFDGSIRVPRRLRAMFRLAALRRRRRRLAAHFDFADTRMQADVGMVEKRHRRDWIEAFLAL